MWTGKSRGVIAAVVLSAAALAPAAHAGLSDWTSLTGMTAADGANWVRDYGTGTPPTTIYAGTEGDGVWKSVNDGLTWSAFSSGLDGGFDPGAGMTVYQLYTSGGKVYAATDGGLFSAPDTISSGGAWTPVAQDPNPDPAKPINLQASVQAVISLTGGPMLAGTFARGVYTSGDKGATWTPPAADNGMPEGTTVWSFASLAGFVWATTSEGVYRSTNAGSTWTLSSDGLPFDDILGIFQDGQNPLIFYAETASSGPYRSIDGGTTWQSVMGDPNDEQFGDGSTPTIHAMQEFSGSSQTRLYTATSDGLWVGTLSNVIIAGHGLEFPGAITWRPVTQAGLGNNSIFWALSSFTNVPGTLLAGTQSNGGYSLTFQPPTNDGQAQDLPSWLAAGIYQPAVGGSLIGTPGNWNGTPQIDYAYQWQRCSSTQTSSCVDIPDATNHEYQIVAADQGHYLRSRVTATNDFPSFSLAKAYSAISPKVAIQPGPLPGDNQRDAATIVDVSPGADQGLPTEGNTLSAPAGSADQSTTGWYFNPAASNVGYQWQRCDVNGDNCADITGATSQTYVLTAADDGLTLRVEVSGYNVQGGAALPISGATNPIIPLPAQDVTLPTLSGMPTVGSTLVGGVGTWASPATFWTRQWEQCEPDGSDCSPIQGATGPEYTVQASDLGTRLKLDVTADVNPADQLPLAVDAFTPLSKVATEPPGTPTPTPKPKPGTGTEAAPKINKLAFKHGALAVSVSAPGRFTVALERVTKGHRSHRGACLNGQRKHTRSCNRYTTVATLRRTASRAGTFSVALPTRIKGHALPPGRYALVVTPLSSSGRAGTPRTLRLVLVHH